MASEGIFVHACEGMASLAAAVAAAGGDAGKLSGRTVGEACDTITPLFCSLGMALKVRATAADGSSARSQVPARLSFLSVDSRLHHCANARVRTRTLSCRALYSCPMRKRNAAPRLGGNMRVAVPRARHALRTLVRLLTLPAPMDPVLEVCGRRLHIQGDCSC